MTNSTALVVVDVQESFRNEPYWSDAEVPQFVGRLQALIDGCAARKIPILQVFHVEEEGSFSPASGLVTTLDPLKIAPDAVFHKRFHSALAGTQLGEWLRERGIGRLIVSGIRTEQCCETTARHASDSGFAVDYVTEATLTFPMTHPRSGRTYSSDDLKERTELVLEGRFARIATVEAALG
jgi:nicotinamidase-related amidase